MNKLNGKVTIVTDDNQTFEGTISLNATVTSGVSELVLYNDMPVILRWALYLIDGTKIYESEKYARFDTCKVHLEEFGLSYGTNLHLKAIISATQDKTLIQHIVYTPNGHTEYIGVYNPYGLEYDIEYFGDVASNEKPPVLVCSTLKAHHSGAARLRWKLYRNGSEVYSSGVKTNGDDWSTSLRNLGLQAGDRLVMKAAVVGGADSSPYVVLEYDPTSTTTAEFRFSGNAFKNFVMLFDIWN